MTDQPSRNQSVQYAGYVSIALEARELLRRLRIMGWKVDILRIPRKRNEECDAQTKGTLVKAGVPLEVPKLAW